ncbi:MAG TPA: hypothetical protein VGY48_04285 [Vicinamibacterales bacterium]|nr:hypothetical protein [Vicinamibacterales bacterium]
MKRKPKLSTSMTLTQFDHGYWYATELKAFACTIGILSASPGGSEARAWAAQEIRRALPVES